MGEMVIMDNCSILVLSCDINISLLNIFWTEFWDKWRDCALPVYLGLEESCQH